MTACRACGGRSAKEPRFGAGREKDGWRLGRHLRAVSILWRASEWRTHGGGMGRKMVECLDGSLVAAIKSGGGSFTLA
jgi:hypothetical protein